APTTSARCTAPSASPAGPPPRSGSSSIRRSDGMDAVLRAAAIYVALLVIFRIRGKRTLAQVTTFDFALLLIISEATQQAPLGDFLGWRFPRVGTALDGTPVVLIERGRMLEDRMRLHHLDAEQVLQEARSSQGVRSLDEIDYAILERSGVISVILKKP